VELLPQSLEWMLQLVCEARVAIAATGVGHRGNKQDRKSCGYRWDAGNRGAASLVGCKGRARLAIETRRHDRGLNCRRSFSMQRTTGHAGAATSFIYPEARREEAGSGHATRGSKLTLSHAKAPETEPARAPENDLLTSPDTATTAKHWYRDAGAYARSNSIDPTGWRGRTSATGSGSSVLALSSSQGGEATREPADLGSVHDVTGLLLWEATLGRRACAASLAGRGASWRGLNLNCVVFSLDGETRLRGASWPLIAESALGGSEICCWPLMLACRRLEKHHRKRPAAD